MRLVGPLVVGLLLLARPARAADKQIRPLVGFSFHGATTFLVDLDRAVGERHGIIGVQSVVLGNIVGVEVDVARAPGFFQTGKGLGASPLVLHSSVMTAMGSVVI